MLIDPRPAGVLGSGWWRQITQHKHSQLRLARSEINDGENVNRHQTILAL